MNFVVTKLSTHFMKLHPSLFLPCQQIDDIKYYKILHKTPLRLILGRVWNSVGAAYPRKKRIKPAKRRATNARSSAARPQFKPGLNCAVGLSQKRGASRVGLSPTHVSHPRSQTGPALAACCPCREPVMTEGSCVIISAHQWPNVWLWPTGPAVLRSSIC